VPWYEPLAERSPDILAAWLGIEQERFISVRREVRRRAGAGSAAGIAEQLAGTADALAAIVRDVPDEAFRAPGGEGDWNVAQAIGHDADARAGLALAGALAAQGRFPAHAAEVVPGVAGPPDAAREQLLRRIELSQRLVERSARSIAGHETDPCPLVHPLVGRLRCGEWLLFAGVHDVMHLEQLERLRASFAVRG
jgi:hypothetical protein